MGSTNMNNIDKLRAANARIAELEARLDAIDTALDYADAPDATEAKALDNDPIIERIKLWKYAQDELGAQLAEAKRKLEAAKAQWRTQFEQRQFIGDLIDNMPQNLLLADLQKAEAERDALRDLDNPEFDATDGAQPPPPVLPWPAGEELKRAAEAEGEKT